MGYGIYCWNDNDKHSQIASVCKGMTTSAIAIEEDGHKYFVRKKFQQKIIFIADRQTKVVKLVIVPLHTDAIWLCLAFLFHQICPITFKDSDYNSTPIYWWGYCNLSIPTHFNMFNKTFLILDTPIFLGTKICWSVTWQTRGSCICEEFNEFDQSDD